MPQDTKLHDFLQELLRRGGSDLLLVHGAAAAIRKNGEVEKIDDIPLDGSQIESLIEPALTPVGAAQYRDTQIADSSYRIPGLGRFRINLHRERGHAAATIRALPVKVPAIGELGLPSEVGNLAGIRRGLVLIGGAAGAGKSTTLAALVNEINQRDARHIVTIEDPVEYEHAHVRSVIEQVEVGTDAPDFPTALRAALRQAPDVLVVGEMRDPESMAIAVSAAETGHLVLSTLHTTDVASAISRISDSFPMERQNTIRQELAMAISAILTQTLLPSRKGGRVPAVELLMIGYGARQHIRHNALQHLNQEITMSKAKGSIALEESLARLVRNGHLDREEAMEVAVHPDELKSRLRGAA
ncbi:MAG: PilT/PilU family type 4a pilus ATPase [Terriglobales bacterium]